MAPEQQSHVKQGADQLITFHKNTCEPGGVKKHGEIPGTSRHDSFGLKNIVVKTMFGRLLEAGGRGAQRRRSRLCAPEHHDSEEARRSNAAAGGTSSKVTSIPRAAEIVEGRA